MQRTKFKIILELPVESGISPVYQTGMGNGKERRDEKGMERDSGRVSSSRRSEARRGRDTRRCPLFTGETYPATAAYPATGCAAAAAAPYARAATAVYVAAAAYVACCAVDRGVFNKGDAAAAAAAA